MRTIVADSTWCWFLFEDNGIFHDERKTLSSDLPSVRFLGGNGGSVSLFEQPLRAALCSTRYNDVAYVPLGNACAYGDYAVANNAQLAAFATFGHRVRRLSPIMDLQEEYAEVCYGEPYKDLSLIHI